MSSTPPAAPARPSPAAPPRRPRPLGRGEFIALVALSMALAALGVDLMLPAFDDIRADLGLAPDSTAVAGLVTTYFLGLAVGQLLYGPLADRFGRRRALYLGYSIYGLGAVAAAVSPSFGLLLVARFAWGIGAAGPRVVTLAVVRDRFEGEAMAKTMSFVMAVFIMVPVVAPTLGAGVIAVANWRWLFGVCALAVSIMAVWALRLPETLRSEYRREFALAPILRAGKSVVTNRQTVAYTLAMTALYGGMISYVASSEAVFDETFGQADNFPFLFGALAALMGVGMVLNATFVGRVGTRRLAHLTLLGYVTAAAALVAVAIATDGRPPLLGFMVLTGMLLFGFSILLPNLNTIAMQPMGHIAGTAASVIGATQVALGSLLGAVLDQQFEGTVTPLAIGFLVYGSTALLLVSWAERGRLFRPLDAAHH